MAQYNFAQSIQGESISPHSVFRSAAEFFQFCLYRRGSPPWFNLSNGRRGSECCLSCVPSYPFIFTLSFMVAYELKRYPFTLCIQLSRLWHSSTCSINAYGAVTDIWLGLLTVIIGTKYICSLQLTWSEGKVCTSRRLDIVPAPLQPKSRLVSLPVSDTISNETDGYLVKWDVKERWILESWTTMPGRLQFAAFRFASLCTNVLVGSFGIHGARATGKSLPRIV